MKKESPQESLSSVEKTGYHDVFNLGKSSYLREFQLFRRLQHYSGEEIVEKFFHETQKRFTRENPVPVLVCAFNEESDLPITLVALARSILPIKPIIVNNNSGDRTSEFAEKMGATVIVEKNQGLAHALRRGFQFFLEQQTKGPILLTDADSFPRSSWAAAMVKHAQTHMDSRGGEAFSSVHFTNEDIRLVDFFRSTIVAAFDVYAHARGKVVQHGANAIIFPSENSNILESLAKIDTSFVRGTDSLVKDTVRNAGGKISFSWSKESLVFTRGDRYSNIKDVLRVALSPDYREELYSDWYHSQNDTSAKSYESQDGLVIGKFKV